MRFSLMTRLGQETVRDVISIAIIADDLPGGIDAPSRSQHRARKVEGGEVRPDGKKSVLSAASVNVRSDDLAKCVDVVPLRNGDPRKIEAKAISVRADEAMLERRSDAWVPTPDEIAACVDAK